MKVSEAKKYLEDYDDDDHIVCTWIDKENATQRSYIIDPDTDEDIELTDEQWAEICEKVDSNYTWESITSDMVYMITDAYEGIEKSKSEAKQ